MAEDNTPINSLDPLGPEFGKINAPTIDQKGLTPFEGDRMSLPDVKVPTYFPVIPTAPSLDRPDQDIRDNVVGSPIRRPPVSKQNPKLPSAKDFSNSLKSYMLARESTARPQDQYAKIYSYDASHASNTFYDRYAAYGQEKFDQIGFHPLRDNEALYNAKTSGWNDFTRMMSNSFVPLFTRGFVSGPKSLYKMIQGDFSADTEDALAYERAAAIGQSSKAGFGAFMNNTLMNFGYTAGIISEAILEEVAGAALAPLTGGSSFLFATANNLNKVDNAIGGLNMARGFAQAENLGQGANAFNKTLNSFNSLQNARRFLSQSAGKVFGSSFSPIDNLTGAIIDVSKNADNLTGMARLASTMGKTGAGFYRDVRGVNMALSEARLEGGFVENKVYQDLYDDYYRVNGKAPDNNLQYDMRKQSKEAAATAMMWNTLLIYGTNKVTFGNIMSPKGGIRKYLGAKTEDVLNYKYGKVVFEKAGKAAAEGAEASSKALKGEFKFIDKNFKNWAKGLTKDSVPKSVLKTIGYFKANFSEGLQENAQDVIAQATEKYYIDSFKNPALAHHMYGRALSEAAIKEQFSAQGFETFASGFFMGMFAGPLNSALPAMSIGYNRYFNTEDYQKYKEAREKVKNTTVKELNALGADPSEFFNSRLFNYAAQDSIANNLNNVDTKLKNDMKEEAFIRQILTALDTNTLDNFKEHIASFKEYTPEEFEEAFGFEKGTGQEHQSRIDNTIAKMDGLKKLYDNFNERMPSPVNFSKLEPGTEEYRKASIYDAAWREGRKNFIFFNQNFKDVTGRMSDVTKKYSEVLSRNTRGKIPMGDMQVIFEQDRMLNEVDILKTEIEALEASTNPLDKKRLNDKVKKYDALKQVLASTSKIDLYDENILEPIIKEQVEGFKKEFADQGIEVPTDEEIENLLRKAIRDERSEQDETYKTAVTSYLKTLADINGDSLFDEDLEEAYTAIQDYNKLGSEAKAMAAGVNLLHNPTEFYTHVERNYKWMSDLYDNRKEYYDGMVNQVLDDIELNAILNALAAQNVYISEDDLIAFRTQFRLPQEFYDATRKMVIRQTSPDYNFYAQAFINVVSNKQEETKAKESQAQVADSQLQEKLDILNKEEQDKIDALPKERIREGDEAIPFGKSKTISIKVVADNLNSGEYADLTYNVKGGTNKITVYKDGNVLKYDNEDGDDVDLKNVKERFTEAVKYRISFRPNPESAKAIKDEYAEKRADLINTFIKKGAGQAEAVTFTPFTKDTPFDEMDEDLQNELRIAFQNYLEANPDIMEELVDVTDDVYQESFESFIRTQPESIETIERYNRNKQLAVIAGETSIAKAPLFTVAGVKYDFATYTPDQVADALRRMRTKIVELKKKETDGTITPQEKEILASLRLNIGKAEAYLNAVLQSKMTPEFQETMNKFQRVLDAQKDINKPNDDVYIAYDAVMKRVTTAIRELYDDAFEYPSKNEVQIAYNLTLAKGKSVADFIESLENQLKNIPYKGTGVNNDTLEKLRKELDGLKAEELTFDTVLNSLMELTYEARKDSGTYLDDLIRKYFSLDPNTSIEFNPDKITREAYDSLFGPEGYLTGLKKRVESGELYIYSEKIRLFDTAAKVAGEPDLIVIDRKTGAVFIIDIKTGDKKKWKDILDPNTRTYNKNIEYALQQTAYRNLLYNMTGIDANFGLLPIETDVDVNTGKILIANRPDTLLPGKITLELTKKDKNGKSIQELVDTIIPRVAPAEEAAPVSELTDDEYQTFVDTGNVSEERLTAIANKYKNNIPLTDQEQAIFNDKTAEINAKLVEIADAEGVTNKGTTAEQNKVRLRNIQAIQRRIEILDQKRNLLKEDASKIKDTLNFLDKILELSTESAGVEVDALLNKIQGLEKVADTLLKSKQKKRGEKIQFRADEIRSQIKYEFRTANDILNRVRELRQELEQLDAIQKDLTNQQSYYRNLIKDKNFKTLGQTELLNKLEKIQRKMGTIEKLIKAIKSAIAKSLSYLKEYLSVWKRVYAETKAFKGETGFRELSQQELADLIKSTSEADKIKLDSYAGLKNKYEKLFQKLNSSMDDVDFIEEVKENEETRLNDLINKLKTYDDQIRYISDLFDDVSDDVFMEPKLSDNNAPDVPSPVNTVEASSNTAQRSAQAAKEVREEEDEILSEFILEGEDLNAPDSQLLVDYLTRIKDARGIDDIQEINASLSKFAYKLTADEVMRISQAIKSRIEVLKSDPTAVPTTSNNLKNGDQLIVKNAIFSNKKLFASKLDTLHVTKVDNDGVSVINLTTKQPEKLTFADLNDNAMLKDAAENVQETPPVELTNDEKTLVNTANTSIIDFINDPELKKEAEDYADGKSLDELENELFDTNICD